MKKIKEEIIGINNIKLNIFKRLTLSNCKKLNKLFFNSVSLCDKLTQELSQFCPINDNTIMKNNSEEMQIKKLIIKKIRLKKKKKKIKKMLNLTKKKIPHLIHLYLIKHIKIFITVIIAVIKKLNQLKK